MYIYMYVFSNPQAPSPCDTRSIFKIFNRFKFSFPSSRPVAIPMLKSSIYSPIYLLLEEEYLNEYISHCEIQTVFSRIWNRVTMSISYNNNCYATSVSIYIYIYIYTHVGVVYMYNIFICISMPIYIYIYSFIYIYGKRDCI